MASDLIEGIALHRLVDRMTDVHPGYLAARQRLFEDQGRYAGIVADVVFDHVLSCTWPRWVLKMPLVAEPREDNLDGFLREVEQALLGESARVMMSESMRIVVERMVAGRWLHMYACMEDLEKILWMMSRRFSMRFGREVKLWPAVKVIERECEGFERDFEPLMDHLIEAVRQGAHK